MQNQAWSRMMSADRCAPHNLSKGMETHATIDICDGCGEIVRGFDASHNKAARISSLLIHGHMKSLSVSLMALMATGMATGFSTRLSLKEELS